MLDSLEQPGDGAARLEHEIEVLGRLDLEGLRAQWRRRYGPAPALRSPELLRLMLAWRIHASQCGGLDPSVRHRLKRGAAKVDPGATLPVGARLAREWQGRVQEVEVIEGGYQWDGRTWLSLSAVARAITGTRWNGPRFFGLREGPSRP